MIVFIVKQGSGLPLLSLEDLEKPVLHAECENEVNILEDGRVQCLTCMKIGYPARA